MSSSYRVYISFHIYIYIYIHMIYTRTLFIVLCTFILKPGMFFFEANCFDPKDCLRIMQNLVEGRINNNNSHNKKTKYHDDDDDED